MTTRTIEVDDRLYQYILDTSLREHPVLAELRAETAKRPESSMQISPEQGQFMGLLVKMLAAVRTIEIGVYTGYSSIATALALPPDGRLIACDTSEKWTSVARQYWKKAGVEDKIELRSASAIETLDRLLDDGQDETYDFVFIDADKTEYDDYYERSLRLIRPGGVIAVDNTLWGGRVADPSINDEDTEAIKAFNKKLHGDERVDLSLVPIGDGLTIARKRARRGG